MEEFEKEIRASAEKALTAGNLTEAQEAEKAKEFLMTRVDEAREEQDRLKDKLKKQSQYSMYGILALLALYSVQVNYFMFQMPLKTVAAGALIASTFVLFLTILAYLVNISRDG